MVKENDWGIKRLVNVFNVSSQQSIKYDNGLVYSYSKKAMRISHGLTNSIS